MRDLEIINSHDFFDIDSLVGAIQSKLDKYDSVLTHTLSLEQSNYLLLKLVDLLGAVSQEDITVPDSETFSYLHRVEVCKQPIKDRYGFRPLSTTDLAIPCHTEDYFMPAPSDIVIFQCIRQDDQGGQSILAYLESVLSYLDEEILNYLKMCEYPSYFGKVAIIEEDDYGRFQIRFNRGTLNKASTMTGLKLLPEYEAALYQLDLAVSKSQISFNLQPYDIWIVNNKKALHGRTALSKETDRLLKRVKLYV